MKGRFYFTSHAVNRYIKRFSPESTYNQALGDLINLGEQAKKLKELGSYGCNIFEIGGPKTIRLIAQRKKDGGYRVLTVILTDEYHDEDLTEIDID